MDSYRHLVEARIREYRRHRKERAAGHDAPATSGEPLEVQLIREIRQLRAAARAQPNPDRAAELRTRANRLETQLAVLLEGTGRPLMAQLVRDRLR